MQRRCFSLLLGLVAALVLAAAPVLAANPSGAFTLTPLAGSYVFEGNQNIDDDAVFGLALGVNIDEHIAVEGLLRYLETNLENSSQDLTLYAGQLDLLYHFFPQNRFVPYVAAGLGYMVKDLDRGGSDEDPLLNYGVGLKYFVSDKVALRLDARHIFELNVNEGAHTRDAFQNLAYSAGLTFHFGGSSPAVKSVEQGGPSKIAPVPAPAEAPVVAALSEAEMADKAAVGQGRVEAAVMVDSTDSDGDGILDTMDKCPGTPEGVLVDHLGCPPVLEKPRSLMLDIHFATGRSEVAQRFHQELAAAAAFMKQSGGSHAVVEGHTDSTGAAEANLKLSLQRAESVRAYLIRHFGIEPGQIKAAGFGAEQPVADNATAEGRRLNRRVVLTVAP
ncbi:membrane protein [Desulfuromonas versatilis]|uniref:Membrane protein n=1 Tax=Desulfuromonas versatilis TaxID=2802975 RepID=A0ABN6DZ39_9BACT|nr:OmpA family protein [Desulfuromonas versatilis]BCR05388.1 membrane protein [Desulfuromonas versatilis]